MTRTVIACVTQDKMKGASTDRKRWSGTGKRFRGRRLVHEACAGQPKMWVAYCASCLGCLVSSTETERSSIARFMNFWPFPGAIYLQTGQPCAWHFIAESFAEETPGRSGSAKSVAEPGRKTLFSR